MLLTIEEAAAKLGYHAGSVRKLVADGKLPAVAVGRRMKLIPSEAVESYQVREPGWQKKSEKKVSTTP